MSVARRANAWDIQQGHALYPDLAGNVFIRHGLREGAPCTICGALCPHITAKKHREESPVAASVTTQVTSPDPAFGATSQQFRGHVDLAPTSESEG